MSKYEFVPGYVVHPDWTGREKVPIPPQSIRERLRLPARYALATLSPELKDTYSTGLYDTAYEYLRRWPSYLQRGMGPVFVGPTGCGTSWTAAALANEIVTHCGNGSLDVTCSWLSTFWMLRLILDHKDTKNFDAYSTLRNNMLHHKLVVVDDLLGAKSVDGGIPFMHMIYATRYDAGLPTITTISTESSDVWRDIQNIYGRNFVERLRATSTGLFVQVIKGDR